MKKLLLLFSIIILSVGCSKPTWHVTSQGYYIYGEVSKKGALYWDGPTIGCFVHGEGSLLTYNKNGSEISSQTLRTRFGVVENWKYVPCDSYFYLGESDDDLPNGFGVKVDSEKYYVGNFKDGELYSGDCEIYLRNGEDLMPHFKGNLKKGKAFGVAKYYQNGLLSFEGGVYNGYKNGIGVEYQNDTILYEGYFKRDLYHGTGKLYQNGVLVYDGEWHKGKRDGYGVQYDNGLIVYKGEWEDDVYDGKGVLYKDGKCIEGKWEEGMLKKSISESTFKQIKTASKMWLNPDSVQNYIEEDSDLSENTRSQIEFIQHFDSDIRQYLAETLSPRIEKRFGFWHLLRMVIQPWTRSDVKRAKLAEEYFCRGLDSHDLQNWINAKIDYHNKQNQGEELHYVHLPDVLPQNTIIDTKTAILIFDREAMETTDVVAGILVDILLCVVVAFILGFLLGFFFPPLVPYAFVIDIVMGIIAFGIGMYLSVFRTTSVSLELESQIQQLMVDNYMQFLESQNIIAQMLGML